MYTPLSVDGLSLRTAVRTALILSLACLHQSLIFPLEYAGCQIYLRGRLFFRFLLPARLFDIHCYCSHFGIWH